MILAAPLAWAQESPPVRVRGKIDRIEGPVYVIKARDGAELKLTIADKPQIAANIATLQELLLSPTRVPFFLLGSNRR